jgi:hypothetical protein
MRHSHFCPLFPSIEIALASKKDDSNEKKHVLLFYHLYQLLTFVPLVVYQLQYCLLVEHFFRQYDLSCPLILKKSGILSRRILKIA